MRQAVRTPLKIRTYASEPLEGRRLLASIAGTLFADLNFNGRRDANEQPSQINGTAYLDANRNNALDAGEATTPFGGGAYRFLNVAPGPHAVRMVLPNGGLMFTTPTPADVGVPATPGANPEYAGPAFGIATTPADGTIAGYQFRDEDASGTATDGDIYARFGFVFLDANNNAARDAGEPTAVVDANTGRFAFYGLADGTYTVRGAPQFYQLSTPATQTYAVTIGNGVARSVTGLAFGFTKTNTSIGVTFFRDDDGDGVRDTGEYGIGYGVGAYVDLNNDNARQPAEPTLVNEDAVGYFFGLADGPYVVRPIGGTGYTPTPKAYLVTVAGSTPRVELGFQSKDRPNTVTGTVFRDVNNNASRDNGEAVVSGIRVYLDADNDALFDTGETYALTDSAGGYTLAGPAGATVIVRLGESVTATYVQSLPRLNGGRTVTLKSAGPVTGQDFGAVPLGRVYGRVYDDKNANNVYDAGDAGLDGVAVYVDLNDDGNLQSGEPTQITFDGGGFDMGRVIPGTYALRQVTPPGYRPVTGPRLFMVDGNQVDVGLFAFAKLPPATATLKGFAFDDKDKDGIYDSGETKTSGATVFLDADNDNVLDSGETKTTTLADGSYTFTGLAAGFYRVRRVFAAGAVLSTKPVDVTVAAGQTLANLAIGSKPATVTPPATASLAGTVFNDNNKNGKFDSGDGLGKGVVVFLDTDNDGKLDAGEKSVTTDARGKFTFAGLAAGTYRVRRVMPAGYVYSGTKPDVTLTSGQAKTGVVIGYKKA